MTGKGVVRSLKNFTKGFSDVQIKVREATSNDVWGPNGSLMNEIAQMTYNQHDFIEVMDMIDKRLNDKGKNWRHVFKALLLLNYCLHVESENVVLYAKENAYVVKTLKEFQHVEENGKDVGAHVRQKAKDISHLLQDDNRLWQERKQRQKMRDRMAGVGDYMDEMTNGTHRDNDRDMARALEEKDDLALALKLSEREAKEKEQRDQSNFDTLFNPYTQQHSAHQMERTVGMDGLSLKVNNNQHSRNPMLGEGCYEPMNNPYLQHQHQSSFQQPQFTDTSSPFSNIHQQILPFNTTNMEQSGFPYNAHQQQSALFDTSSLQPIIPTGSKNPFSQTLSQGGQTQSQAPTFDMNNAVTPFGQILSSTSFATLPKSSSMQPFNSTTFLASSSTAGQSQSIITKSSTDPQHKKLNTLVRSKGGTGFANIIKPQDIGLTERSESDLAGNFSPPSLGVNPTSQQRHQQSTNRNPFGVSKLNEPNLNFLTQSSPFN
ncbi:hypothetical protein BC941DRAFT_449947 [Chlamydoabsidia padenii]|nr:hypothetical protein BC941DRAFT_449947 [Chlamydoabsidia padenii]